MDAVRIEGAPDAGPLAVRLVELAQELAGPGHAHLELLELANQVASVEAEVEAGRKDRERLGALEAQVYSDDNGHLCIDIDTGKTARQMADEWISEGEMARGDWEDEMESAHRRL